MAIGDKKFVVMESDKGVAKGVATLNTDGKLLDAQIPELEKLGAAPAGYGLGETTGKSPPNNDLDNATEIGWYVFTNTTVNAPFIGYGVVEVMNSYVGPCILQIAHEVVSTSSGFQNGNVSAQRRFRGKSWEPWEWITPPMTLGSAMQDALPEEILIREYRTTERYNKKPVYVQLVNLGSLPANASITSPSLYTATIITDIELYNIAANGKGGPIRATDRRDDVSITVNTNGAVTITTTADLSAYSVYALIKYVK